MKKNSWKGLALIVGCCLLMTGCIDNMPDMTKEQQSLVAEYAASLLLKHSPYYDSGLTSVEEIQTQTEEIETEEETEEITQEQETETIQNADSTSGETTATTEYEAIPLEELFGLTDMEIKYDDYEVVDTYPTDENAYFSVNVSQDKKIIAFHFTISNLASEEQECDIFSISPSFSIKVNDGTYKSVMSTLLLDDLATYQDTIAAGSESQVVLLLETSLESIDDVTQASLRVQDGEQISEIPLF